MHDMADPRSAGAVQRMGMEAPPRPQDSLLYVRLFGGEVEPRTADTRGDDSPVRSRTGWIYPRREPPHILAI